MTSCPRAKQLCFLHSTVFIYIKFQVHSNRDLVNNMAVTLTVWSYWPLHTKMFNYFDNVRDSELYVKGKPKNLHTSCPTSYSSAADNSERKCLSSTHTSIVHRLINRNRHNSTKRTVRAYYGNNCKLLCADQETWAPLAPSKITT